jgi:uncharacterized membrane protein YdjX (TVP38/TMEM64 family)
VPTSRVVSALRLAVVPVLVAAALLVAWRMGYFELDRRQTLVETVQRIRETNGSELLFILIFAAGITLCLPANVGTLLAGAVFGVWRGGFLSLAGSMLATVAAYWLARTVARKPVLRFFGENRLLRALKEHDDTVALFRLRVLPVAPFAVLSYLAGVAGVSQRRLYVATALGGIPQAFAYAYAGSALLKGITSSSGASKRALIIAGVVTLGMLLLSLAAGVVRRTRD